MRTLRQREPAGLWQRKAELGAHCLSGVITLISALAQNLLGFLLLLIVEMFDEQHAVEMVELVLEETRFKFVRFDVDLVAIEVVATNMHRLGTHDVPRETRNRQAPFVELPLAVGFDDLGVDEGVWVEALLSQVVDEQPLADAHLGCSKTQPGFVIHCLEHVVDEANQGSIDVGDVFCHLLQDLVAVVADAIGSAHHHLRYRPRPATLASTACLPSQICCSSVALPSSS